jgi:hypothetical protein
MSDDFKFEQTHEEHRLAQIKRMAAETTPLQRWKWLEDALEFMRAQGIDPIEQKRKLEGKIEDKW